jgi:hypothetical protein
MPELNGLEMLDCAQALYGRAEPDDEYPRPEPPLDPKQIDKHKLEFEYEYEEDEDEDDERNYSS